MPKIFAANCSSVPIDGEALEGLQTLHYRIIRANEDIHAIGSDERVDVAFGHQRVEGERIVRSSSDKQDAPRQERPLPGRRQPQEGHRRRRRLGPRGACLSSPRRRAPPPIARPGPFRSAAS